MANYLDKIEDKIDFTEAPCKIEDDESYERMKRFRRPNAISERDDLHDKRVKAVGATSKGINPLLILLLVCVVLTWGIAATLIFNLVDYKSMIDKSKNVQISEDDIKEAVGALYPFQYEAVRHPIKAVGQLLINIDDYITDVFSPRKGFFVPRKYSDIKCMLRSVSTC